MAERRRQSNKYKAKALNEWIYAIVQENPKATLQDIADEIGLTRERIRQIQSKGFRKLNHPTRRFNKDFIHRELKWIEDKSPCKKSKFFARNNSHCTQSNPINRNFSKSRICHYLSQVRSGHKALYRLVSYTHLTLPTIQLV